MSAAMRVTVLRLLHRGSHALAVAMVAGTLLGIHAAPAQEARRTPIGVETTRVTLMLVDLSVLDRDGRPMHGLTKKDFSLRLDRRRWPIYSVDDLCPAEPIAAPREQGGPGKTAAVPGKPAQEEAAEAAPVEPVRVVLYLDFSNLQQDGRTRALREAGRWVGETMRPGDQVMIASYAPASGLRTLTAFTSDRALLSSTIQGLFDRREFVDPFPAFRKVRGMECPPLCLPNAFDEYQHSRRGLSALHHLLTGLGQLPGSKALLMFHQTGTVNPGIFYGEDVGDNVSKMTQVGAEATLARTAIYAAYVGPSGEGVAGDALRFGADLARYTGGRYNQGASDLSALTDEARRRAACIYRIGLLPPEGKRRHAVFPIQVRVRGRVVADELRVAYLTESERWLRKAQAVLAHPETARELSIVANLVPVRADGRFWQVQVGVAVDLREIALLRSAGGREGRWEVGGLLARDEGKQTWEMLGHSEMTLPRGGTAGTTALHRRRFSRLRPGHYSFSAFVRDRTVNVYGGARAEIDLPDPSKGGVAGPILMRPGGRRIALDLPLMRHAAKEPSRTTRIATGPVPLGAGPAGTTDPLLISFWLCGGRAALDPGAIVRYLAYGETPVARYAEAPLRDAGDCSRIDDRLEARRPAGRYTYHLEGPVAKQLHFDVSGPALSARRGPDGPPERP